MTTVLDYLSEVSHLRTAAIAVDYFQDEDRQILVPRVVLTASAVRNVIQRNGKTDRQGFLDDVGTHTDDWWQAFMNFLDTLPGKFYWGAKGFSYRVVLDGKQYPIVWGYPRTCWWLKDKGRGDELEVLIEAKADRPEAFKQLVRTNLAAVGDHPMASVMVEGSAPYARFSINGAEPKPIDEMVRQAITALFTAAS